MYQEVIKNLHASLIFPFPLQYLDVPPALIFNTECLQHFTAQTFRHKTYVGNHIQAF